MKKTTLSTVAAIAGLGWGVMAQAGPVIPTFQVQNAFGDTFSPATNLDWNSQGAGVAVGVGPFGAPGTLTPGTTFPFYYQANLVDIGGVASDGGLVTSSDGGAISGSGLTNPYQYSLVISLTQVVTSITPIPGGGLLANFRPAADTNKVSIFYDDQNAANTTSSTSAGSGFADGLEVARFSIDGGDPDFMTLSIFQATSGTSGQGAAQVHGILAAADDFVNPDYLQGLDDVIFDLHFQATLNYPYQPEAQFPAAFFVDSTTALYAPYTVDNTCVDSTPGTCDIVFVVDGLNQFSSQVPEPGTLLLLGGSLFGLSYLSRRRFFKA